MPEQVEWTRRAVAVLTASVNRGQLDADVIFAYLADASSEDPTRGVAELLLGMINVATTLMLMLHEVTGDPADAILQRAALRAR